ncbi:phage major capsid protein [Romboutsia hominis]|uniref:Phage major capsid protein n=1 Tax=Romboutsia faecis TaxID=2764597 RepID=A0ABR7JN75_9FIRM|nr:phage major capsid protein [Romboutsia faecis]MBC5996372.1 phage major capsid protein [Romboutsia faecis]
MNDEKIEKDFIFKAANVETCEVTEEDLKKINKFTLSPVTAEEVYVFKTVVGDNELDDRNFEPFNLNALKDLKKLYIGKTVIKDHRRSADNQVARIFDTELIQDASKLTGAGEIYTKLVTKQYMIKTSKNEDLIAEIKGGIKKEVSTGCKAKHAYCSICGTDNVTTYCNHYWGKEYNTVEGKKICYFTLDGAKEAYELSLVAVPAQPRAGTTKNYGAKIKDFIDENEKENKKNNDINKESELKLKLKALDSFLFIKNNTEGLVMNKKMREIFAKIEQKEAMAKGFMEDGENKDLAKADTLWKEVEELKKEFDLAKKMYESEKEKNTPTDDDLEKVKSDKNKEDELKNFTKALRSFITGKGLVESVDANGGYTVPVDVSTKVEYYKDVDYSLLQDIDVEKVSTNKGSRTYQKKGEVDTFVDIDENGEITEEIEAPTFERLNYTIQDRAGFMPVSNDLINDSDSNIIDIVSQWLGKADVATSNKKILELVATKDEVDLKDVDGIKKALNVTLGQAYKNGAKIYTNDDGLNYLDTLKDTTGRPLLNPDPTAPSQMQLRCGTTVLNIKVLPNKVFPTNTQKVPFIIGNLFDYVKKFDRQSMSIMASNVATLGSFNAYAKNMTLLRAIIRDDYKVKDKDSIVNGYITIAE